MIQFICVDCKNPNTHDRCPGGTKCFCQHRVGQKNIWVIEPNSKEN